MTESNAPLTAQSTIDAWLNHPKGSPLIKGLLAQTGVAEDMLAPVRSLPLQQLVAVSQGQLPQAVVDDLVLQVNDGVVPAETTDSGQWREAVTPGRFDGKTVIVTGAASGIGRATASRIAREGGRVIAVDLSAERLRELVSEHPEGTVTAVRGDIAEQADIDRIAAVAGERIDALANVAGVTDDYSPVHETTDAMWDRVIGINLTGSFKLMRAVAPLMLAAGKGSIVNVASEAALRGNSAGTAYTVSKHGVVGLTRSAAFMYGPNGVRVNAIAPGAVASGIAMPSRISETGHARISPFQQAIPSLATPEQLAASITFLLSDDGVNINGAVLPSDGGWSVQ